MVRQLAARRQLRDKTQALSTAFAKEGDYAKAYQYFLQYSAYKDSLTAEATTRRLAALEYRQNILKKEAQIQRLTKEQLLRGQAARRQQQFVVGLAACVGLLALFSFILSRNNRAKRRANEQLNAQKDALQQALAELKTAQGQLIQSEKMASLGELTAGIAHEIQNPLNFVNNFAEVSAELVEELLEQRQLPTPTPPSKPNCWPTCTRTCIKSASTATALRPSSRGCWSTPAPAPARKRPPTSTP
ncbi:MAG: hypothetical protein WKG07_03875 [Hymenobacter sp.]